MSDAGSGRLGPASDARHPSSIAPRQTSRMAGSGSGTRAATVAGGGRRAGPYTNRASSDAMTGHSAMTTDPRRGVLRLVVLALTLAGFVAMHGLASAGGEEAHCGSPAALLLTSDAHGADETRGAVDQSVAHHDSMLVGDHHTRAEAPTSSSDSDELMVGCLLALLAALVAIRLRLLGGPGAVVVSAAARQALAWLRTARGPPDPLFLSLCVFRL